jgi:hypothetical protein
MQMEDRSWMYESGDVLAHFKGVSIFLEATAQHATREKEEANYTRTLGSQWFHG